MCERNYLTNGFLTRLLAISFFCIGHLYASDTNSVRDTKSTILAIEKHIGDLTDLTILLRCDAFLSFRKSVTEAKATEIVCLIQSRELKGDAASIGILAAQFLPEERYWAVTMPLLSSHTEEFVLRDILTPALPYGPGYGHSITNAACRKKLTALKNEPETSASVKAMIDLILTAESNKIYSRFKRDPEEFNYNRKFLEPGK
jgi:hypothetical protein